MSDEHEFFKNKLPSKIYVSKRFENQFESAPTRIISRVFDPNGPGVAEFRTRDEVVIRETPRSRVQIKATIYENSRDIVALTLQKFNPTSGPHKELHFSFVGKEIDRVIDFLSTINTIGFSDRNHFQISDPPQDQRADEIYKYSQIIAERNDLINEILTNTKIKQDFIALGYRRSQIEIFKKMLHDPSFFEGECQRRDKRPEALWQNFFEENKWIFGYGLSYVFIDSLAGRSLEQVSTGADFNTPGKRVDGLMKTRSRINSLCFVEIKRHDTNLLNDSNYRPGVWPPSKELAGGVSQIQAAVQSFVEDIKRSIEETDKNQNPTGETLFGILPKSFLVIGNLSEFHTAHGINQEKVKSFELYRRHINQPEIITFDELYERARYIVDSSS